MNIDTKILSKKPREESGPKTSRKYQFQKDLSLFILLKEHSKRSDYLFLFDFHEDLIISNSSTTLKDLECFQIKSKDKGNWTIKALTKQPKGKNSILGKLYYNKIVFEDTVKSLTFISNSKYSFKNLKCGSESATLAEISAKNLSCDDLDTCNQSIKNEHALSISDFEKLGTFKVTTLSNSDSPTHCVGALASLINSINPLNRINSQLAYEQVSREITRKTNETVGDKSFTDISEVFQIKGLSKSQFLAILNKAGLYKSVEDEWNEVKNSLEAVGIHYLTLMKFKSAWREMSARLVAESESIPLRDLRNKIEDVLGSEVNVVASLNLLQIVEHIFAIIGETRYEEYFVKCLIINKLNES
ncbi:dsDNA nuclease domain-containing protein [Catalinimonas sp. 4WD22]|uniref:dsDNA nuclease domain-containing protein n=1 Tax=Catalinimonas locisalis TaxID=3133978 RepID=UPI003100E7E5